MKYMMAAVVALTLTSCAANLGAPREIDVTTIGLTAGSAAAPSTLAQALRDSDARAAIVAGPLDSAWFGDLAAAADLELSGPGDMEGLRMAFLMDREALGDTTVQLRYGDAALTVHDALYEVASDRVLDLLALRVTADTDLPAAMGAFLNYVATDVSNQAAVVIGVAVPDSDTGDRVARLLSPGFFDALRCETDLVDSVDGAGIRLFYGPEARMFCEGADFRELPGGAWVRAALVMGRR